MAVLVNVHVTGCKKPEYDQLRKIIQWEQNVPKGLILHVASVEQDGTMQATDLWDTADDFNNFVKSRLMPGFQKLNLPQPTVQIYPIHNVNVTDRIEEFNMIGTVG